MTFTQKDHKKKKRMSPGWRKPKGRQNKQRLQHKAHTSKVKPGFGTAISQKGKTKDGKEIITTASKEELSKINPKTQAVILARTGRKRKLELIEEAEKLKITILTLNVKKYKAAAEKQAQNKKQSAKEREQKKEDKAKFAKDEEKKAAEKKKADEKKAEEISEEDKKKKEKEEKDKVLTKATKAK